MCPSSWAMVKAVGSPVSWTMEQELALQTVPSSARPSMWQILPGTLPQMGSLGLKKLMIRIRNPL